jgi:hypothetical protein
MSLARRLAEEILNVFKFNPELSEGDKALCIEVRLMNLINDVERSCAESKQRIQSSPIIVDERPSDIPVLAAAMLNQQKQLN